MNNYFRQFIFYVNVSILFSIILVPSVFAIELAKNLQLHGFFTQGAFYSTDNNYNGKSDDKVTFDQTEIGTNIFWQVNDRIDFSAQALYRRAGRVESSDLRVDYAMMSVSLLSDDISRFGIRLGRIKNPIGLYNETRDVAFTTPSILLPQSIYLERSRSLLLSADGGQLFGSHQLGNGWLSFKLNYGKPHNDNDEIQKLIFGNLAQGDLEAEENMLSGQIKYSLDNDKYIFALSYVDVRLDYKPGSTDILAPGTARFSPYILSAQYNGEKWGFTSEYYYSQNEFEDYVVVQDAFPVSENWYLQGTYRFSSKWQGIVRYDVNILDNDDPKGKSFEVLGLPAHMGFTKDSMIGLRWDITPTIMLRGEYHYIDGTSWVSSADNPDRNETEQYWDLFALQLSFRF